MTHKRLDLTSVSLSSCNKIDNRKMKSDVKNLSLVIQ